jgi:hypothetical protein
VSGATPIPPDIQASLVCDDVRQESNGKHLLIGLFETIASSSLPLVYPRLCVFTRWCSGDGEFRQRTRILAPDQQTVVVAGQDLPVRLSSAAAIFVNVEVFLGVRFEREGTHWIEVLLDGALRLRYPLRVARLRAASPDPSAGPAAGDPGAP